MSPPSVTSDPSKKIFAMVPRISGAGRICERTKKEEPSRRHTAARSGAIRITRKARAVAIIVARSRHIDACDAGARGWAEISPAGIVDVPIRVERVAAAGTDKIDRLIYGNVSCIASVKVPVPPVKYTVSPALAAFTAAWMQL